MSATKRYLEDLTEKHALYACYDDLERSAYRNAVLDCAGKFIKGTDCGWSDFDLKKAQAVSHAFWNLRALYDELVAVDNWQPARKRYDRIAA